MHPYKAENRGGDYLFINPPPRCQIKRELLHHPSLISSLEHFNSSSIPSSSLSTIKIFQSQRDFYFSFLTSDSKILLLNSDVICEKKEKGSLDEGEPPRKVDPPNFKRIRHPTFANEEGRGGLLVFTLVIAR